jgi:hypothetical protein
MMMMMMLMMMMMRRRRRRREGVDQVAGNKLEVRRSDNEE